MAKRRGRPPSGIYVNSYEPRTLVAFVSRVAILATHDSYSAFASRGGWKGVGGLESELDRADRALIERVQELVNRSPMRTSTGRATTDRFYLLPFYDSVSGSRRSESRGRTPTDRDVEQDSTEHTEAGLPAHFFLELCNAGPARSKPEVIVRGMAMRAFLREAAGDLTAMLQTPRYAGDTPLPILLDGTVGEAVSETIRDLCIVAGHPPASGGLEATRLLAEAGTLAIDAVREQVMGGSPVSWRLIRVVTECLRSRDSWDVASSEGDPRNRQGLVQAAAELLTDVHTHNPPCVYRARSLWEEAVSHLPKTNTDGLDRFGPMLRQRALLGTTGNTEHESPLPVRERMTAAWAFLWRTARIQGWDPTTYTPLRDALGSESRRIMAEFADELAGPEQHPRLTGQQRDRGLRYAGEFIHTILDDDFFWYPYQRNEALRSPGRRASAWWNKAPEAQMVEAAIARVLEDREERARLEPRGLLEPALGALVSQACLTIDGVSRRESLATLEYSGLGEVASAMLSSVVDEARNQDSAEYRWLIENAVFGLGWMARPRRSMDRLLSLAKDDALDQSIRMTALMAVGDMADEIRPDDRLRRAAGDAAMSIIAALPSTFTTPSEGDTHIFEHKVVVRSAVYLLAMLRDPTHLELLRDVAASPRFEEDTTPALAQWGVDRISIRFTVNDAWEATRAPSGLTGTGQDPRGAITHRRLADPMESMRTVISSRTRSPALPAQTTGRE